MYTFCGQPVDYRPDDLLLPRCGRLRPWTNGRGSARGGWNVTWLQVLFSARVHSEEVWPASGRGGTRGRHNTWSRCSADQVKAKSRVVTGEGISPV